MKNITLGSTGITVPQNGFGALPIQRISSDDAVTLLRRAYEGGIRFFDTARAYSDSEEKVGLALEIYPRNSYFLASKTAATTPEEFWTQLDTSLKLLKTDYLDIYQFHCAATGHTGRETAPVCTNVWPKQNGWEKSDISVSPPTFYRLLLMRWIPACMKRFSFRSVTCPRIRNLIWSGKAAKIRWALSP